MWQGGGEEGERERETHSLTHRVKDWDLVMGVAGRRGGDREGTRDTLTHSQGQGLGPIVYFSSVGCSIHINNFLIVHAVDMIPLYMAFCIEPSSALMKRSKVNSKFIIPRPGLISPPEGLMRWVS